MTGIVEYETLESAAARLQVCVKTVRSLIARGELPGYRLGPRMIRVAALDVNALLLRRPIPAATLVERPASAAGMQVERPATATTQPKRTNGSGSVRRLPSGQWQARSGGVPAGQTFDSRQDAEIWLARAGDGPLAEADARWQARVRPCDHCGADFRPRRGNHLYCEACNVRYARLTAARLLGTHTAEQWARKLDEHDRRCAYCGVQAETLTKDHVVPISKGGSDAIENILPACQPCNSAKRDKLLDHVPLGGGR